MLLNLGAGGRNYPGWTSIDIAQGNDVIADLTVSIPMASNSADALYCSHMLDHISLADVVKFLFECRRVMKKGAVARFAVMDMAKILGAYQKGRIDDFACWQPPIWNHIKSDSLKFGLFLFGSLSGTKNYTGHWLTADAEGWEEIFEMAGWAARAMPPNQSQSPLIQIEDTYTDHSLYLEVTK